MLNILGWIVWILAAFIALSLNYGTVRAIQAKRSVMKATVYQGVLFVIVVTAMLFFPSINKLHLIWVFPLCFVLVGHVVLNRNLSKANLKR